MSKWICNICGYVYDEEKEGKAFQDLPEDWHCPLCGADKASFSPEKAETKPAKEVTPLAISQDMIELSAGALSALCSNLARGCEKQYHPAQAQKFLELADYFAAGAPVPEDADTKQLLALIQQNLEQDYPALHHQAEAEGDRGTQRICVWGEKVTAIQQSLLRRYLQEGDAFLDHTQVWVCTVCGFLYVGDQAPEICPVCKVPAWKFEKIEGRG